ncbi:hypothetical protein TCSYLVIO_006128 [Trypanosoma cruzi]|nr:hypothetical protein TCSYLVIO_006128 [Trypanosoma cruzi]KAF8282010.1 hypothetical protein TcBrA4_0084990 [Trypanosoma cruzi]RNF13044.1 hypothetical protein TcG_08699 [Trypanosoma cruzi]
MCEGVTSDEALHRFDLLRQHLFEEDDTWYAMRAEENRLLYGGTVGRKPKATASIPQRRYFNCFYDSFKQRDDKFNLNILREVLQKEWAEREKLNEYEEEEFYATCRCAGNALGVTAWSRRYRTSLPLVEAEEFGRRMIVTEFFAMLLEAVFILEGLHRRTISFLWEPLARKAIEGDEVHKWVESRRCQVERERREESMFEAGERQRELAYHNWKRQQAYQVYLFEKSEEEERMDVERLQRFYVGIISQIFRKEHMEAQYHQLRYQMRKRLLSAELSRHIIGNEATERSNIMVLQHEQFCTLQAEEVKSFLWTRRNTMLNELVDRERGGEGCVYAYM